MKTKHFRLINVGAFVAIGLSLAVVAIFFLGQSKNFFERRYTLYAQFQNVSGLREGAVVQLAGLNVGFVDGVRFPKEVSNDSIEVILKINRKYKERIRQNSMASITTQGLLGDKSVSITTGTPSSAVLEDGAIIMVEEVNDLNDLADVGKETLEAIQEAAKKLTETLDKFPLEKEDRQEVERILQNMQGVSGDLHEVFAKVKKGEGTVGALLSDAGLYHDLRALMGHANRSKVLKNLIRATLAEQEKAPHKSASENP